MKPYMLKTPVMKPVPVMRLLILLAGFCLILAACQKEYSTEFPRGLAAEGSLQDSTGNCMHDSIVGTFYGGVEPGRDTAYILVKVNVTNTGSYSIYTDTQDGFYFSDSGYFSARGLNTIKLKPVGTPIIAGPYSFNITFDSTVCSFNLNVQDSTGTGLGGGGGTVTDPNSNDSAWKFTGPVGSYHGPVDTAFTSDTLGVHYLNIIGFTSATGDTAWQVGVAFSSTNVTPGSYSSKSFALFRFTDATNGNVIYSADPTTTANVTTIITINTYDATTKVVTGTFSGTAADSGGNVVTITGGAFTAKVQ